MADPTTVTLTPEWLARLREEVEGCQHVVMWRDLKVVFDAAERSLTEPARIAAAVEKMREAGVRAIAAARAEGAEAMREAAAQAVEYVVGPDIVGFTDAYMRGVNASRAAIRALPLPAAPPAEPEWTPTHRHYKGGLYRELMRVEREGDRQPMVVYEAQDGIRWVRAASEFDGEVWIRNGDDQDQLTLRRFEPIAPVPQPADSDGWIEWDGATFVPTGRLYLRFANGAERWVEVPRPYAWATSGPHAVVAYRSAPADPAPDPVVAELSSLIGAKLRDIDAAGRLRFDLGTPDTIITALEAENAKLREESVGQQGGRNITEAQVAHMVDRFLNWKLPEDFNPDGGISFQATYNEHTPHPMKAEPVGTNLLDATQAKAMVRHMIENLP